MLVWVASLEAANAAWTSAPPHKVEIPQCCVGTKLCYGFKVFLQRAGEWMLDGSVKIEGLVWMELVSYDERYREVPVACSFGSVQCPHGARLRT